jgi:hypothetical protein
MPVRTKGLAQGTYHDIGVSKYGIVGSSNTMSLLSSAKPPTAISLSSQNTFISSSTYKSPSDFTIGCLQIVRNCKFQCL